MSKAQRNQWGTLCAITDDSGQAHNVYCSQQADGTAAEQIAANDEDPETPWGIPLDSLIATWLSDGTVTCRCADSYLPADAPTC